MTRIQTLIAELQTALEVRMISGQIVLNFNESRLASVETKTFTRIAASSGVDKPPRRMDT